jgi:hypothetical protein
MQAVEHRVRLRLVMAEKADDVAHGSIAHAERHRIACGVGDLVERAGVKAVGPGDLDGIGIDELCGEAGRRLPCIGPGGAYGDVEVRSIRSARAGLVVLSNTNSSRAGPVIVLITGAVIASCPGLDGMSPCQPTQTIV